MRRKGTIHRDILKTLEAVREGNIERQAAQRRAEELAHETGLSQSERLLELNIKLVHDMGSSNVETEDARDLANNLKTNVRNEYEPVHQSLRELHEALGQALAEPEETELTQIEQRVRDLQDKLSEGKIEPDAASTLIMQLKRQAEQAMNNTIASETERLATSYADGIIDETDRIEAMNQVKRRAQEAHEKLQKKLDALQQTHGVTWV